MQLYMPELMKMQTNNLTAQLAAVVDVLRFGYKMKQTGIAMRTLTVLLSFPWSMVSVADSASIAHQFFSRSSWSVLKKHVFQFSL